MKRFIYCLTPVLLFIFFTKTNAQSNDSLLLQATLENCIQYALIHQPTIQQSLIDEQIAERTIKEKLADWYPQVNLDYSYQHYFQLPTSVFQGNTVRLGVKNTSSINFSATQNIFNRDVIIASQSADDYRDQAKQATTSNKINLVAAVSKAFYDVLLNLQQIRLLNEDISLFERSLKVAYDQYQGGVVDKVDYKRATITLNNATAQMRVFQEQIKGKYAYLKELMNYPESVELQLVYDSLQMKREAFIDTTQIINYESRIEYQLLQTQKKLQQDNLKYNKWSLLPTLSAFGSYNFNFLNNDFSKLYNQNYPTSYAGLSLSFPIFQGMKRNHQIKQAELELQRVDYDIFALRNSINTQYAQALATYKGSLSNYRVLEENLALATEVYNTIQVQYKAGVKSYLDVIISQNDLVTAQVSYLESLYRVLTSKVDVQQALGIIQY